MDSCDVAPLNVFELDPRDWLSRSDKLKDRRDFRRTGRSRTALSDENSHGKAGREKVRGGPNKAPFAPPCPGDRGNIIMVIT